MRRTYETIQNLESLVKETLNDIDPKDARDFVDIEAVMRALDDFHNSVLTLSKKTTVRLSDASINLLDKQGINMSKTEANRIVLDRIRAWKGGRGG